LRAPSSITQGGSPVRESRTPGSVRGVPSNGHSYRDRPSKDHSSLKNAPECDYSSFYVTSGTGTPLPCCAEFSLADQGSHSHPRGDLALTVLYFPIFRVSEYSEYGWQTCSALAFHSEGLGILKRGEKGRAAHRQPSISAFGNSLSECAPAPVP
jgi:hypothetical protein